MKNVITLAAGLLAAVAVGTAHAEIVPLGNSGLYGPFSDDYSFSVGAGQNVVFDAVAATEITNRYGIFDFAGALYGGDALLAQATSTTVSGPVWPLRQLDFEPLTLGAGDYRLRLFGTAGTAFPTDQITLSYAGTLSLAPVTAPIPEPATWALFALGGFGLWVARRRG